MKPKLIAVVLVVLVVWALLTLPASLFLKTQDAGLSFDQVDGTIWSGTARLRLPAQSPMPLQWAWAGGLTWHWTIANDTLSMEGQWRLTERDYLREVSGRLAIESLDVAQWLVVIWPEGDLEIELDSVTWSPMPDPRLEAQGEVIWRDARLAGVVNERLGDITIQLSPGETGAGSTRALIGSSARGAVRISGDITTDGYAYQASIALRPEPRRSELLRYLRPLGHVEGDAIKIERSGYLGVWQ